MVYFCCSFNGSQSHHTGIEINDFCILLPGLLTPNRTILELKSKLVSSTSSSFSTPNRTILELKYYFRGD